MCPLCPMVLALRAQGGHASVHSPHLARDPPRLVAEEEQRRCGDVVGLSDLAERMTVPASLHALFAGEEARGERRVRQ